QSQPLMPLLPAQIAVLLPDVRVLVQDLADGVHGCGVAKLGTLAQECGPPNWAAIQILRLGRRTLLSRHRSPPGPPPSTAAVATNPLRPQQRREEHVRVGDPVRERPDRVVPPPLSSLPGFLLLPGPDVGRPLRRRRPWRSPPRTVRASRNANSGHE